MRNHSNFKRLLLVSLDWTRAKDPRIPLGHGSILAAVKRDSPQVNVTTMQHHVNYFEFKSARDELRHYIHSVEDHNYSCMGFGVYIWNDHIVTQLLKDARLLGYKGTIVLGGPQISYSGKEDHIEQLYPEADAFVRGYGENVIVKLLNSSPTTRINIPGLQWKGEEGPVSQAEPLLEDLPSPYLSGSVSISPFVRWETQRGCPFKCSFCQHREAGHLLRRNLEQNRIMSEIDLFCDSKVEDIAVLDPTFNSGHLYKSVMARYIAHGFIGRISLQCRFEMVDNDFLDLCSKLNVRLEFGLQTIHKIEQIAIERPNNMRRVASTLSELNSRGINYEISIIFGLPQQTLQSFKETVTFCLQHQAPVVKAFPLMLLRGTSMHKNKNLYLLTTIQKDDSFINVRYGLVENDDIIPAVVSSPTFTFNDWKVMEAISVTLKETEGNHPSTVDELLSHKSNNNGNNDFMYTPKLLSPEG